MKERIYDVRESLAFEPITMNNCTWASSVLWGIRHLSYFSAAGRWQRALGLRHCSRQHTSGESEVKGLRQLWVPVPQTQTRLTWLWSDRGSSVPANQNAEAAAEQSLSEITTGCPSVFTSALAPPTRSSTKTSQSVLTSYVSTRASLLKPDSSASLSATSLCVTARSRLMQADAGWCRQMQVSWVRVLFIHISSRPQTIAMSITGMVPPLRPLSLNYVSAHQKTYQHDGEAITQWDGREYQWCFLICPLRWQTMPESPRMTCTARPCINQHGTMSPVVAAFATSDTDVPP